MKGAQGSPSSNDAVLLFTCPALFSGLAMLGVDLKAFLRPNKELHLRVEARFLSKPANGLLRCPREFGFFFSWDVNLQKVTRLTFSLLVLKNELLCQ